MFHDICTTAINFIPYNTFTKYIVDTYHNRGGDENGFSRLYNQSGYNKLVIGFMYICTLLVLELIGIDDQSLGSLQNCFEIHYQNNQPILKAVGRSPLLI